MKGLNLGKILTLAGGGILYMFTSNALQAQTMSFQEAYEIMHQENSALKAVEKQEEIHEYEWKAAKGLRYPTVKAFGVGMYLDRSIGADLNGLRNGIGDFIHLPNPELLGDWSFSFNKRDMAVGGFMVTWPLYTGGKINAAVKAKSLQKEMGEKDLETKNNQLISELAQRYYAVKLADEAVKVRKEVLVGMEHHLHDATKLEENGMIAPVERLYADVAVSEAKRQLDGAQKDIALARTALANTLEMDEVPEELVSDFFTVEALEALSFYKESALRYYPLLQKLVLQKELAEQGVKAKKSAYYPTVAAFGQSILVHNNPMKAGMLYNNDNVWVVGVGVSYTLFEGFRNRNEIKAAKATKESVELFETKAQNDIQMLVTKLYQDIEKQQEQINNLSIQVKLGEELLRVRSKAFTEGFATSTDVVDAEMKLSGIKLQKLQAYYNYAVNVASLLEYSGLSKEFIKYAK
ncbi:TolC family protein [Myroides pelagicus]|uniref:TolC family protein n=1 Tax=Myroides pelagicus TaxID=270914 RepID=A0A7K1GNL9_9FLAO|nr:TolC family protein [Myroides pelagicus]MEC4113157.1 TolC family protein [Myroides pelagicus]MTH29794.1 TolC family protein [Myroides pelagicus]